MCRYVCVMLGGGRKERGKGSKDLALQLDDASIYLYFYIFNYDDVIMYRNERERRRG